jgi:hypothetical protein
MSDRFADEQTGQDEPPGRSAHSQGASRMHKEREAKEDGRYIIFYTFENEREGGED